MTRQVMTQPIAKQLMIGKEQFKTIAAVIACSSKNKQACYSSLKIWRTTTMHQAQMERTWEVKFPEPGCKGQTDYQGLYTTTPTDTILRTLDAVQSLNKQRRIKGVWKRQEGQEDSPGTQTHMAYAFYLLSSLSKLAYPLQLTHFGINPRK